MKKKTEIEEIKKVYGEIPYKTDAIENVAEYWSMTPGSVKTNWFSKSGFWSVPLSKQKETLEVLKKTKKDQLKELKKTAKA